MREHRRVLPREPSNRVGVTGIGGGLWRSSFLTKRAERFETGSPLLQ